MRILALQTWHDFVTLMLNANAIDITDLMDAGNLLRENAQEWLSFLVRNNAIWRRGKFYRKSPAFTSLLKELEELDEDGKKEIFTPKEQEY